MKWPQFRIRTLLLAVAAVAVFIGLLVFLDSIIDWNPPPMARPAAGPALRKVMTP